MKTRPFLPPKRGPFDASLVTCPSCSVRGECITLKTRFRKDHWDYRRVLICRGCGHQFPLLEPAVGNPN